MFHVQHQQQYLLINCTC